MSRTTPRDAASVICVRASSDGSYEVLLTLRPETMRFMGGMYVFPGGALDPSDASETLLRRSAIDAASAHERLKEGELSPRHALGLYCAGLRELFEEVGVLVARTPAGSLVDPERVSSEFAPRRHEIAGDGESFARFLEAEGLELATDLLVPHGRLVTPEMSPIRFDARFFVLGYPEGQQVLPDPDEVPEALWLRPSDAIARSAAGGMPIAIPTMAILQGLAETPAADQLLAGHRPARSILVSPLGPRVVGVLAPNPGPMTGPGTTAYVVGNGRVAIVDPGVDDGVFIEALTREAMNRGVVTHVLVTHTHPDHIGGASYLARQFGCELGVHVAGRDRLPDASLLLREGDRIELGDGVLEVLHAPGHASDHVCYLLDDELFAGDVVAGLGTVVIAPPDGDMRDYLNTLRRLRTLPLRVIHPAHGPRIDDPAAKLDGYIDHRLAREAQVVEALEAGLATTAEMVTRIYTDVPPSMHSTAELSVLAHLEMLESDGRARRAGPRWEPVR
ncbi:MAG TPA: MBL fold metallo-hydrolase [Actinomycetota bacterium]|nr:MBL fold metallo-hydrolase [Actinomycetota bacterium]